MNKVLRNRRGFTLVELLAVIVVLAIVMGMAVVGITSVLENTRKSAFAADAKSYLEGAHQLVRADEANKMLGGSTVYAPDCSGTGGTNYIKIDDIPLDSGGKSPYGTSYKKCGTTTPTATTKTCSFVEVKSTINGTKCTYSYKIRLMDDFYRIQLTDEDQVNASKVAKTNND